MSNTSFHELNANKVILIASDLLMICIAFSLTIMAAHYFHPTYSFCIISAATLFFTFLVVLLISLLCLGLYNEKLRENNQGIALRIFVAILITYGISSVLLQSVADKQCPTFMTVYLTASTFMLITACRISIQRYGFTNISINRVLVIGAGRRASIIQNSMRRKSDRNGFEIVGFVPTEGDEQFQLHNETIISLSLKNENSLEAFVNHHRVDEIVVAVDERRNTLSLDVFFHLKQSGTKITDIIDFVERETGKVAIDHLDPSWMLYHNQQGKNRLRTLAYSLLNSAIAIAIALITLPLMIIATIAIKIECGFRFPVIYSQERVGLRGRIFKIYKFTSMRLDAEKNGAQWASKEDPRVTKVGKIIRKFRVDELPQLYNVLRGDMYFVGPRPERPQFTKELCKSIPFYDQRLSVKPGLTGWAQLRYPYGSSEKDALEKLKFDLYYIRHRNLMFDLLILLKTSEIIIFGQGR